MLFVVYIDFETTAPTDSCLNSEDKEMFAASYIIIFAFHPELKLDRIIIEWSYRHLSIKLLDIDYITE